MSAKVAVIVAAAGASTRFGGKVKKPFTRIDDRPVFIRSLELFINRDDVCQTILAVSPDDAEMVKEKFGANLGFMGVQLCIGGRERWETIGNALKMVKDDAELIAVHDAVRPCLTVMKIDEVFAAAEKTGAAIVACPVDATLKRVAADGTIEDTVDRANVWQAQTPQVFRKQWIVDAYATLGAEGKGVTDDAQVVQMAGHKVTIVENDMTNIKITRQSDLSLAGSILKILPKPKKAGAASPFESENMW